MKAGPASAGFLQIKDSMFLFVCVTVKLLQRLID